jgi:inosine/xanthosine triphosphate pyrophosphatase family protein
MAMKLLLGTTNPVKISIARAAVDWPLELLTPPDLNLSLEIPETGQTTLENAEIKARAYFERTNLPTLAIDGGLWVEKFSAENQPGVRIKRMKGLGTGATDQEVLAFYIRALDTVGGESPCTWEGSLALALPGNQLFTSTYTFQTLLTAQAHGQPIPGIALAPITLDPRTGKYFSELAWDEHPDVGWIRQLLKRAWGGVWF